MTIIHLASQASNIPSLIPKDQKGAIDQQQTLFDAPAIPRLADPSDQKAPKKATFKIEVTMRAGYSDVEMILGNWKAERQQAPKLAAAIRLLDAIERGDEAAIRQSQPWFVRSFEKEEKTKKRPPLRISDSDSLKISEKESEDPKEGLSEEKIDLMIAALFEVTGCDPKIKRNGPKLRRAARDLVSAEYTADDVRDWYQRVWLADWRGKRGDLPELQNVEALMGRVRLLPKPPEPSPQTEGGLGGEVNTSPSPSAERGPGGEVDPYLADPYFRGRDGDDPLQAAPDEEQPRPALAPHGAARRAVNWWDGAMGEYQIQLNRSTYDTWLRHTRLVEVDTSGNIHRFTAIVSHAYAKDWLTRHLLPGWIRKLDSMYNPTRADGSREFDGVEIILRTEDEDLEIVAQEQKARATSTTPG